jgi:hypothetical protein
MAYGALIEKNEYPHVRAAPSSWTVWIYDLAKPRMPGHGDPHFHFELVDALGGIQRLPKPRPMPPKESGR